MPSDLLGVLGLNFMADSGNKSCIWLFIMPSLILLPVEEDVDEEECALSFPILVGLLKNGSKSGTSNDMSNLADEIGASLVIEKEVSGKALAKDASNASKLLNKLSPTGGDDDDPWLWEGDGENLPPPW